MRKEVRHLREKAINSLVNAIEHFNRPWDRGRMEAVLIMLDHSFEMLMKAAILHRNGRIMGRNETQTIGFDACVRKGNTDGGLKFLTDEQALTLRAINGQRDAAQHHLVDMSENQLYFYAQAGVTLFRGIHDDVFRKKLIVDLPERVLPVSTTAPRELSALFDKEVDVIVGLLKPGTRKKLDAMTRARSLAVLERAINGNYSQPSENELAKMCRYLASGRSWQTIFPGVASVIVSSDFDGPVISLRLTKNEGMPVRVLKEGEDVEATVAVRRVNELDFYSLGATDLAKKVGLTVPKTLALIDHLRIRDSDDNYREVRVGKTKFGRYSSKAVKKLREALETVCIDRIWEEYKERRGRGRRRSAGGVAAAGGSRVRGT